MLLRFDWCDSWDQFASSKYWGKRQVDVDVDKSIHSYIGDISIYWFCWCGFDFKAKFCSKAVMEMFTKHIHSVNLLLLHDRFLANQTFVTIQFCYWLNRKLKLLCLPSNLGEKNGAQGSLSKAFNVLLSSAKATMGSDQHALYQTQCMHFFTPHSFSM